MGPSLPFTFSLVSVTSFPIHSWLNFCPHVHYLKYPSHPLCEFCLLQNLWEPSKDNLPNCSLFHLSTDSHLHYSNNLVSGIISYNPFSAQQPRWSFKNINRIMFKTRILIKIFLLHLKSKHLAVVAYEYPILFVTCLPPSFYLIPFSPSPIPLEPLLLSVAQIHQSKGFCTYYIF